MPAKKKETSPEKDNVQKAKTKSARKTASAQTAKAKAEIKAKINNNSNIKRDKEAEINIEKKTSNSKNNNNLLILIIIILSALLMLALFKREENAQTINRASELTPTSIAQIKDLISVNTQDLVSEAISASAPIVLDGDIDLDSKIGEFIMNNPELILESVTNYQNNQVKERENNRNQNLSSMYDELVADLPFAGNKNAKHEIVEFYDYNCGYCKQVTPTLNKILSKHKDTKIYYVDFPILGKSSRDLAMVSTAVYLSYPEKFFDAHNEIMKMGRVDLEAAAAKLEKLDINKDELIKVAKSSEVSDFLAKNRKLAQKLSVSGTPAFIINEKFFGGALSYDAVVKELK